MTCGRKIGPYDCCSVVQGDCREHVDYFTDAFIDAVVTDPPYGIRLENHAAGKERRAQPFTIAGDDSQDAGQATLDSFRNVPTIAFASPKKPWAGEWGQHLVWWKGPAVGGGGDVRSYWKFDWELIQIRGLGQLNGQRDCSVLNFWITPQDSLRHPAEKPESLMLYLVGKIAAETILDPFCGSGSTLVAAKKLGRHYLGFEISPEYCEIARKRLADIEAQPTLFEPKPEQMTLEAR